MELTDRELAVRWWDRKTIEEKEIEIKNANLHFSTEYVDSNANVKEHIWRYQQKL